MTDNKKTPDEKKSKLTLGGGSLSRDDILKRLQNKGNVKSLGDFSPVAKNKDDSEVTKRFSVASFKPIKPIVQTSQQLEQKQKEAKEEAEKKSLIQEAMDKTEIKSKQASKQEQEKRRPKNITVNIDDLDDDLDDNEEEIKKEEKKSSKVVESVIMSKSDGDDNTEEEEDDGFIHRDHSKRDETLIKERLANLEKLEFDEEDLSALDEGRKMREMMENMRLSKEEQKIRKVQEEEARDIEKQKEADRERYAKMYNKPRRKKKGKKNSNLQREIEITSEMTVERVSDKVAEKTKFVLRKLSQMGIKAKADTILDLDTIQLLVEDLGHKYTINIKTVDEVIMEETLETQSKEAEIAPVVTIMGHVDHGKTSLLDALRQANVVDGESGGITQHIGAYQVKTEAGKPISFIDTPGHAAFTEMRARGAKITDIVIIVVAADDGINDQTVEAINHAKASGAPIIVAINKIDLPGANVDNVKQQLMQYDLMPEDFGGEIMTVAISAKERTNLDKLLDAITLTAEMLELKGHYEGNAYGYVLEARVDKQKGVLATIIPASGRLKRAQVIATETATGRIRQMKDSNGRSHDEIDPVFPVEVSGLTQAPMAGEKFYVVENDRRARQYIEDKLEEKKKAQEKEGDKSESFESLLAALKEEKKKVNIILKSDVQGTLEAIKASIEKIKSDEVDVVILHSGIGAVNDSDLLLARTNKATVLSFHLPMNQDIKNKADKDKIDIRQFEIIYNLIDDVKDLVSSQLSPIIEEVIIGKAQVKEIFNITKAGNIAGCSVVDGIIKHKAFAKVMRDGKEIESRPIKTLKHFKENVKEISKGNECGIQLDSFEDIQAGDTLVAFETKQKKRTL